MRKLLVLALCCGGFLIGGAATAEANKSVSKRIYTHDFITATNLVGRYYGSNVRNWLQSCSSSEGGHGRFVWFDDLPYPKYGYSTTPGGWMQFMASTYHSNEWNAYRDAARRGLRIHPRARSYYQPLGQAVVAAYIYRYYGSGQWTGAYC